MFILSTELTIKMLMEEHNELTGHNKVIRYGKEMSVDKEALYFTYNGDLHHGFADADSLATAILVTIQELINEERDQLVVAVESKLQAYKEKMTDVINDSIQ